MATGTYNITIEKGITFDVSITLKDNNNVAIWVLSPNSASKIVVKVDIIMGSNSFICIK